MGKSAYANTASSTSHLPRKQRAELQADQLKNEIKKQTQQGSVRENVATDWRVWDNRDNDHWTCFYKLQTAHDCARWIAGPGWMAGWMDASYICNKWYLWAIGFLSGGPRTSNDVREFDWWRALSWWTISMICTICNAAAQYGTMECNLMTKTDLLALFIALFGKDWGIGIGSRWFDCWEWQWWRVTNVLCQWFLFFVLIYSFILDTWMAWNGKRTEFDHFSIWVLFEDGSRQYF